MLCYIFHLRAFVKFWESVDLRAFSPRPAPPRGFLPLPRPAGKKAAPHIPAKKAQIAQKITSSRILPSRIRATIHSRLRSPVEQKLLAQFTCFFINPPFILYLTDIIHHVNQ